MSIGGQVDSITDSDIVVTAKKGPVNVAITASTRVIQLTPAQLPDVKVGSCVDARRPAPTPGKPQPPVRVFTALTVSDKPANADCAQVNEDTRVRGAVVGVKGPTVSVNASSGSPTDVTTDPKTQYLKQAPTSALMITEGACVSITGTAGPGGVLQALSTTVRPPAANGSCPLA